MTLGIRESKTGFDANARSVFGAPFSFGKVLKFDRSRPGYLHRDTDESSVAQLGAKRIKGL